MNKASVVKKTAEFVKKSMIGEGSGHDWWHIYRVWQMAKTIAKKEKADMFVVELGALLHDIADYKFHNGDEEIGPKKTSEWLNGLGVDGECVDRVAEIVRNTSFRGARVKHNIRTLEGKIVYDADKLDAMGAIGIARTFAFGGFMKREIYDPNVKPYFHKTFEEYKNGESHTINHFYEKLLLLKNFMHTKTAKKIAKGRHRYLKDYLSKFYREWGGKE